MHTFCRTGQVYRAHRRFRLWPISSTNLMVLYTVLQLPALATPPLGRDSWRETDVLMVARNFCREDAPIWLPRIDARGDGCGITGMELPVLAYVIGKCLCLGANPVVVGRAVTLATTLVAAACCTFLAALGAEPNRRGITLVTATFLFSPLVFYYGRAIQPDMPALSLALLALCLVHSAVQPAALCRLRYGLGAATMGLAIVVKLPVIVFGLPAFIMVGTARTWRRAWQEPTLYVFLPLALLPSILWYHHARALQVSSHLYHFTLGRSLADLCRDWSKVATYRTLVGHFVDFYAFLPVTLTAVLAAYRWRLLPLYLRGMVVATGVYFVFCGMVGVHHLYYGLPAVPVLCLLSAVWLSQHQPDLLKTRGTLPLCVGMLLVHGIVRTQGWSRLSATPAEYVAAKQALDAQVPLNRRVTLLSNWDPTVLWFIDRRGWLAHEPADGMRLETIIVIDGRRIQEDKQRSLRHSLCEQGYCLLWSSQHLQIWLPPKVRNGAPHKCFGGTCPEAVFNKNIQPARLIRASVKPPRGDMA